MKKIKVHIHGTNNYSADFELLKKKESWIKSKWNNKESITIQNDKGIFGFNLNLYASMEITEVPEDE